MYVVGYTKSLNNAPTHCTPYIAPTSPLHHPTPPPTSPLNHPHISPTSPLHCTPNTIISTHSLSRWLYHYYITLRLTIPPRYHPYTPYGVGHTQGGCYTGTMCAMSGPVMSGVWPHKAVTTP